MKIALIGDHILDIYIHGKMNRFSPESPLPIFDYFMEEARLGGASNVYNNLIALGAHVDYYYDPVNFSTKRRYVCDGHIMFRMDDEKNSIMSTSDIHISDDCKYVILSDYNKGVLSDSLNLVTRLKREGKTVIVDPKRPLEWYQGADVVKMNLQEMERYYTPDIDYGIETLVITMGGAGVKIISREGVTTIPGLSNQVSDVTGAGDVFISAMTYYLSKGKDVYRACDLANRYAAKSVTKFGTYTITPEDIREIEGKVVFTNGCFDILHRGHVQYLQESKKLGDRLIVGLNSDASVKKLKGSTRPVNNQEDRKKVLEALNCVDQVIIFDEDTPYDLIKRINPDIITKGGDYTFKHNVVGHDLAEVVLIPYVEGYSTTKTLEYMNGDC